MLNKVASNEDLTLFHPQQLLMRENEAPTALFHIVEGWACRYHKLPDGRRQITALYLPGECCDPTWILGHRPRQPIMALTIVRAVPSPCRLPIDHRSEDDPALWKKLAINCERQATWLVSLGRKSAVERLAYLLLELFERMRRAGLTYGPQCALPLTQTEIGDVTGLTPVHVNRTLQSLRARGLVDLQSKWLRILNAQGLRAAAGMEADEMLI